ncbi:MAG TPA: NAD(P)-dependent oxidoreductase [Candidatus Acidoferrales bacterium]|nr:NAD(P)-dependent oxidoreductase [Candidatus Acidoferrales bacterium]
MSYLVTGGTGFIGAYTIRDLLRRGEKVVSFDASPDLSIMGYALTEPEIEKTIRVFGDITDLPLILNTIKEHNVEHIVHMASLQIPASDANPYFAVRVNCEGTANIFEACRIANIKRLVWASSIAVFGPPELYGNKPVLNDAPHHPVSVYGACKSLNEYLAKYYFEKHSIDSVGLRFTAVYGLGRVRGKSSFTTKMIEMAAKGEPYTVPYGDDVVDWQYVEDLAGLIVHTLDLPTTTKTRVFNTQGDVRPVMDGVNYLRKMKQAKLQIEGGKFGIAWEFDTTPLRAEIGFEPRYSMEQGIERTYEAFLKLKN